MKKIILITVLAVMIPLLVGAEVKLIENPAAPKSKNAGRIIIPAEVMRITDESGDFFFKQPVRIGIAPDESIFVTDEDQFLRFDKNGKFLNNQFKKGQGPGEYTSILHYQFINNKVVIFTSQPYKIIKTGLKGNLLEEVRLRKKSGFKRILGFVKDKFLLVVSSYRKIMEKSAGEHTLFLELAWGTTDGQVEKTGMVFPEKWHMVKATSEEGEPFVYLTSLVESVFVRDQSKYLYVSNTRKYLVHQVDLEQGKIVRRFNRKYKSIPFKDERTEEEKKPWSSEDNPGYFVDVLGILVYAYGEQLWVLTSTVIQEKGILVDVFAADGTYIDNFYLKLPGVTRVKDLENKPFTFYKNFLFTSEEDEEGNKLIVKYKI